MKQDTHQKDVWKVVAELALVSAKAITEVCLKKLKEKGGKKNA